MTEPRSAIRKLAAQDPAAAARRIIEVQDDRDRWVRLFNGLEKAVTNHLIQCDDADDLMRAHRETMRLAARGEG